VPTEKTVHEILRSLSARLAEIREESPARDVDYRAERGHVSLRFAGKRSALSQGRSVGERMARVTERASR
jgi:hypothetical protein